MGLLPPGQGLLVLCRFVRCGDEHPDHELSRPDTRVVAVLQNHRPRSGPWQEPPVQLVVDDPLDLILLRPFHGASDPCHCLNVAHRNQVPGVTYPAPVLAAAVLAAQDVSFLMVGSAALWLHGEPVMPADADAVIAPEEPNLRRLHA